MQTFKVLFTRWNATILILFVAAIVLLMASRSTEASAPNVPTEYFICTPQQVGTFSNRVHVRCVPSAPSNIAYFAVCSTTNSAFSARALSVFTTAKVTAKNLAIYYTSSDTSGTACGCSSSDCRVLTGVEVMP